MYTEVNGTIVLVGIISSVTFDVSFNGVVPLESLHELLRHPEKYRHDVTDTRRSSDPAAYFVMTRLHRGPPERVSAQPASSTSAPTGR